MASSPQPVPVQNRGDEELLGDLCIELRNVAVRDYDLPGGQRLLPHIQQVVAVHAELVRRGVDCGPRLDVLSAETKWQMRPLLDDCLAFPTHLPFVRELDGIRRTLRCRLCSKAERPRDAKLFWFCDACMRQVAEALRQRAPLKGVITFRTYNAECRCSHADADTVLAADLYIDQLYGVCEKCISDELERRRAA
jgi:hypothetical protein